MISLNLPCVEELYTVQAWQILPTIHTHTSEAWAPCNPLGLFPQAVPIRYRESDPG
jgi:hypothetical protein